MWVLCCVAVVHYNIWYSIMRVLCCVAAVHYNIWYSIMRVLCCLLSAVISLQNLQQETRGT
jgi:hypothetical protein